MSQKSGFFYVKRLPKKIHHFLFSIVFLLLGTTVADAAGYTCSTKRYTSCAANYYLTSSSAGNSCALCSGVTNSTSTRSGTESCTRSCSIANGTCSYSGSTRTYTDTCNGNYTGGSGGSTVGTGTCTGCSKYTRTSTGTCSGGTISITCNTGYSLSNGACVANTYTCAAGQYLNGTTCKTCEAGYACPGGTWTYNGGVQGRTECSPGTYNSSTGQISCSACGSGYFCTGGTHRASCASLIPSGSPTNPSIYSLSNGSWSDYTHATKAGDCQCYWYLYDKPNMTQYLIPTSCSAGINNGPVHVHYEWCATGYYASGSRDYNDWYSDCTACTNKPANSYYTSYSTPSTMYAVENNCPWACNANYYKNGSSCAACSDVSFTETGSDTENVTGGTRTRSKSRTCYRTTSAAGSTSSSACTGSGNCGSWSYGSWTYSCTTAGYYKNSSGTCSQCEAGNYCSGGVKQACGGGKWSAAGASSCKDIDAGCYGTSAGSSCPTKCASGTYSTGGAAECSPCPSVTTYKRATVPSEYYMTSWSQSQPSWLGTGWDSISRCMSFNSYTSSRGMLYDYTYYNSSSGRYDTQGSVLWYSVNPGYYLTTPTGCGSYAYYGQAVQCPTGSYCPGKSEVECNSSNQATVHTTNFGLNDCPDSYPNSGAGATAVTSCYSGTKKRAMTSCTQDACSNPDTTGCSGFTCAASCSCAGTTCDYVAYSNSAGTGDGTIKSGCSTNAQSCIKAVASLTAKANYYVNGTTSCPACSSKNSGYPYSAGGSISYTSCYSGTKSRTWSGSQTACSKPANSASYSCDTCAGAACDYVAYLNSAGTGDGTIKSGCSTNTTACQQNVKSGSVTCNANYYQTGIQCLGCDTVGDKTYTKSQAGNSGGAGVCYKSCSKACTQQSTPTGAYSVTHGSTSTSGTHYYGGSCSAASSTCALTVNSCRATYYKNENGCSLCSGLSSAYANSNDGNSSGTSACFTSCGNGTWVASAKAACTDVTSGYHRGAHDVSYGSTDIRYECPDGYAGSDGTRAANTSCYAACSAKTITGGSTTVVNAKEYYNGSAYPACTYNVNCKAKYGASGNKTSNPACTLCNSTQYSAGGTATCTNCSGAPEHAYYHGGPFASSACEWLCETGYVRRTENQCAQMCTAGFHYLKSSTGVSIPLYTSAQTTHSIVVQSQSGAMCYASLAEGAASGAINVNLGGTTYHAIY